MIRQINQSWIEKTPAGHSQSDGFGRTLLPLMRFSALFRHSIVPFRGPETCVAKSDVLSLFYRTPGRLF